MRDGFYDCSLCGDRLIGEEQDICTTCLIGEEERKQEYLDDAKDEVEYD